MSFRIGWEAIRHARIGWMEQVTWRSCLPLHPSRPARAQEKPWSRSGYEHNSSQLPEIKRCVDEPWMSHARLFLNISCKQTSNWHLNSNAYSQTILKRSSYRLQQFLLSLLTIWGLFSDPQMDPQMDPHAQETGFTMCFRKTFVFDCLSSNDPQTILIPFAIVFAITFNDFEETRLGTYIILKD